ncbi:MAG: AzlD domain-containing protein [Pseudomonadota bacterium]
MSYSAGMIWFIIFALGVGTYLIRFSFLGLIGDRPMPPIVLRLLRYTPVAVLPAMVAPLVVWPEATDGVIDPARLAAALVSLAVGYWKKNVLWAIGAGAVTLYLGLFVTGQF